ncbi:phosphate ABC transporter substrate-binding protein PstS [bacterium]|nr:phosphate ABC transporter substrate-binding protein PstS [bacterium]
MNRIFPAVFIAFFAATSSVSAKSIDLLGAGATFPYPLYAKMFDDYNKETHTRINYQAIGSGGGVRQLQNRTVDFGATDAYISNKSLKKFDSPILHIPTCLGAVVITYNLPGSPKLTLSGQLIADIYLGKVTRWNDPRIRKLNPGVKLPNLMIAVIHRADGSGTSHVFTDYLAKVSPEWKQTVGAAKSVNWPAGLGGKGNPGVAGLVKQIPGSIGYVELVYTIQNKMQVADVRNRSGHAITPSVKSVSAAVPETLPDDLRLSITDTPASDGYPISSFTWIVVYQNQSKEKGEEIVKLLRWILNNSEQYAENLGYAAIPPVARSKAEQLVASIKFK